MMIIDVGVEKDFLKGTSSLDSENVKIVPGDAPLYFRRLEKMKKISVIVPVHNTEQYIRKCLDSILNQNLNDIEVICINDGSTDNSGQILSEYESYYENVRVLEIENSGVSRARNIGIENATGEYISFVDSDDYLTPGCLDKVISICDENMLDICYFSYENFYDTDELSEKFPKKISVSMRKGKYEKKVQNGISMIREFVGNKDFIMSCFVGVSRRDFIIANKISFPEGIVYEDGPYALQLLINAGRVICLNEVYYRRRVREGSYEHRISLTGFHLYSYLQSCLIMFRIFDDHSHKWAEYANQFSIIMERRIRSLQTKYNSLSKEEYDKFIEMCGPLEQMYFNSLIKKQCEIESRKNARINALEQKIIQLKDEKKRMRNSWQYKIGGLLLYPLRKIRNISAVAKKRG
ncbi:MAG: glycosyltransferase [Bacillota bacterium]|nr:glycosyltransferase [Bacillota bacterium]